MDEDTKRRIREKGGDPDSSAFSAFKKRVAEVSSQNSDDIASSISKKFETVRKEQAAKEQENKRRRDTFRPLYDLEMKLRHLFESKEAILAKVASTFSLDFNTPIYRPGYRDSGGDRVVYQEPTKIDRSHLVVKLNSGRGVAISAHMQTDNEGHPIHSYTASPITYEKKFARENRFKSNQNEPLLIGGFWIARGNSEYSRNFSDISEVEEYIRDLHAEALIDHKEKFIERLTVRSIKATAALGLTILFLRSCTPVLGQEADPANDFLPHQPEEPAIGMSFDQR